MNVRFPNWRQAATVVALVLLVLRLALPAHALPHGPAAYDGGLAGLLGGTPICHSGSGPATPDPAGHPAIPAHDCALCPVCQLAAALPLLPAAAWVPPPPPVGRATAAPRPPSIGPPLPARYAASPRGPPASAV